MTLFLIFVLQVVSTAVNTLKTIFITKGIRKPAYIATFIDAVIFVFSMKLVLDGGGIIFLLVYGAGKTIGVLLGDVIERRLAIGTLEVTLSAKQDKAIPIADSLRQLGYSVNTRSVHGFEGADRFEVWFVIKRNEVNFVTDYLEKLGYGNLSMVLTEVKTVTGKINTTKF